VSTTLLLRRRCFCFTASIRTFGFILSLGVIPDGFRNSLYLARLPFSHDVLAFSEPVLPPSHKEFVDEPQDPKSRLQR
jgi:hypothetical protein